MPSNRLNKFYTTEMILKVVSIAIKPITCSIFEWTETKNGRQEPNLVNESRMNISPAGIAISFISIVARLLI